MIRQHSGFVKYADVAMVEQVAFAALPQEAVDYMTSLHDANPANIDPDRFIYTRERAMSAFELHGLNCNYDGWFDSELKQSHGSFMHVPRFVDHDNMDPDRAVGIVLDVRYHPVHASDSNSGWVETISANDKEKMATVVLHHLAGSPTLLEAIESQIVTDHSMGCFVAHSVCTVCGNAAYDPFEYCDHVRIHKGQAMKISTRSPLLSLGAMPGDEVIAGEINFGCTFFELSHITTQADLGGGGADLDAKTLERLAKQKPSGWEKHLVMRMNHTTPQKAPVVAVPWIQSGTQFNTVGSYGEIMKKKTQAADTSAERPQVVAPPGNISQQDTAPDYPADGNPDKDNALYEQAKPGSDADKAQVVVPSDRISQETSATDYAQAGKQGEFIPTNADPANTVGETPPQVADGEEKMRTDRFDNIREHLDSDDEAEAEDEMEADFEAMEEDRLMAAIKLLPKGAKKSEAIRNAVDYFRQAQDAIRLEKEKRAKFVSERYQLEASAEIAKHRAEAREIVRKVLAYGTEVSGKGLQQSAIDAEGYDQGDPDKALNQQSQGTSEPSPPEHVMTPEDVAQTEGPDRPPGGTPGKAARRRRGRKVIAEGDGAAAADELVRLMQGGMKFEEAQAQVFETYGKDPQINMASGDMMEALMDNEEQETADDDKPMLETEGAYLARRKRKQAQPPDGFDKFPAPGPGEGNQRLPDEMEEDEKDEGNLMPDEFNKDMKEQFGGRRRKRAMGDEPEYEDVIWDLLAAQGFEPYSVNSFDPGTAKVKIDPPSAQGAMDALRSAGYQIEDAGLEGDDEMSPGLAAFGVSGGPATAKRIQAGEDALDQGAGESASDISSGVSPGESADSAIGKGKRKTLVSPATEGEVGGGGDLLQAKKLSKGRQALLREALGEDADAVMETGTGPTKGSPATEEIASEEGAVQRDELAGESKGNNATPPDGIEISSGAQLLGIKISKVMKENLFLREANERLFKRAEAARGVMKLEKCRAIARKKLTKGFYLTNPKTETHLSLTQQKHARNADVKRLMAKSMDELEEIVDMVNRAQTPGSLVPRWTKRVRTGPAENAVKSAATSHSVVTEDDGEFDGHGGMGENFFGG